jgi:hypothetical protein
MEYLLFIHSYPMLSGGLWFSFQHRAGDIPIKVVEVHGSKQQSPISQAA